MVKFKETFIFGKNIDMKLLSYILASFNGTRRSFPGTDLL